MTQSIPLIFRERNADDRNFIIASWMRGFRNASSWAHKIPSEVYSIRHEQLVKRLLNDSHSIVACSPDDPNQIFGFAIYQPSIESVSIIHWIYVKQMYRKLGIGNEIFREVLMRSGHDLKLPVAASHETRALDWAANKFNVIYNPYLAFEVDDEGSEATSRLFG